MSATEFARDAAAEAMPDAMLSTAEKNRAAASLTLAMLALGLFGLSVLWSLVAPDQHGVAQVVMAFASLLVAAPVLRAAWRSLREPGLNGVTDQLVALATLGAWATGNLVTAVLLPVIMIFGEALEGIATMLAPLTEIPWGAGRFLHVRTMRFLARPVMTREANNCAGLEVRDVR